MKPALALLILAYALAFCPRPDQRAPWERPGYQEPRWASELRILIDVALRQRELREARP